MIWCKNVLHWCCVNVVRVGRGRACGYRDCSPGAGSCPAGRLRNSGESRPGAGTGTAVELGAPGSLDAVGHQDHSARTLGDPSDAGRPRDRASGTSWISQGSPDPVQGRRRAGCRRRRGYLQPDVPARTAQTRQLTHAVVLPPALLSIMFSSCRPHYVYVQLPVRPLVRSSVPMYGLPPSWFENKDTLKKKFRN